MMCHDLKAGSAEGWSRRQMLGIAGATMVLPFVAKAQAPPDEALRRPELAAAAARLLPWPMDDAHGDRMASPAARLSALTVPRPLPKLRLTALTPTGELPRLTDTKGVLLHFWAPWCAPCIRELPLVMAGCQAAGITLVTVSTDKRVYAVLRFCSWLQLPISSVFIQEHIHDPEGLLLGGALPATLVVDASGLVRARAIGEVEWRSPESWEPVTRWCK